MTGPYPETQINPPEDDLPQDLAAPARRALDAAGVSNLTLLSHLSESEVRLLHGIGPRAMEQLRRALAARGLSFRDPAM